MILILDFVVEDRFGDTATLDTHLTKEAMEPKPLLANSRPDSIIISDTPSFPFTLFSFSLPPSPSPPPVSPLIFRFILFPQNVKSKL